ncbi:hypothetical protein K438DRAFT_1758242 [Mycena galopus ATCC 62051]|nr:hypothetical protein K438DRAFT_1758242 [Mycena galopus ATCC 62051]
MAGPSVHRQSAVRSTTAGLFIWRSRFGTSGTTPLPGGLQLVFSAEIPASSQLQLHMIWYMLYLQTNLKVMILSHSAYELDFNLKSRHKLVDFNKIPHPEATSPKIEIPRSLYDLHELLPPSLIPLHYIGNQTLGPKMNVPQARVRRRWTGAREDGVPSNFQNKALLQNDSNGHLQQFQDAELALSSGLSSL